MLIFDVYLYVGAFCVWRDNSDLVIYLGCGSTVVPESTVLQINGGQITSYDGTSVLPASYFAVSAPTVIPQPEAIISVCDLSKMEELIYSLGNTPSQCV